MYMRPYTPSPSFTRALDPRHSRKVHDPHIFLLLLNISYVHAASHIVMHFDAEFNAKKIKKKNIWTSVSWRRAFRTRFNRIVWKIVSRYNPAVLHLRWIAFCYFDSCRRRCMEYTLPIGRLVEPRLREQVRMLARNSSCDGDQTDFLDFNWISIACAGFTVLSEPERAILAIASLSLAMPLRSTVMVVCGFHWFFFFIFLLHHLRIPCDHDRLFPCGQFAEWSGKFIARFDLFK